MHFFYMNLLTIRNLIIFYISYILVIKVWIKGPNKIWGISLRRPAREVKRFQRKHSKSNSRDNNRKKRTSFSTATGLSLSKDWIKVKIKAKGHITRISYTDLCQIVNLIELWEQFMAH
jgi:hypothetical protein